MFHTTISDGNAEKQPNDKASDLVENLVKLRQLRVEWLDAGEKLDQQIAHAENMIRTTVNYLTDNLNPPGLVAKR